MRYDDFVATREYTENLPERLGLPAGSVADKGWVFAGGCYIEETQKPCSSFSYAGHLCIGRSEWEGCVEDLQAYLYYEWFLPEISEVPADACWEFVKSEILRLYNKGDRGSIETAYCLLIAVPELADQMERENLTASEMIEVIEQD